MSFTCFPQLPTELRLKVWKHALPGPRTITIYTCIPGPPDRQVRGPARLAARAPEESTLNVMYYTCKDARSAVKGFYESHFGAQLGDSIWFNNDVDTISFDHITAAYRYFKLCEAYSLNNQNPLSKITKLNIAYPIDGGPVYHSSFFSRVLCRLIYFAMKLCPDLKQFTFFMHSNLDIDQMNNWLSRVSRDAVGGPWNLDDLKFELVRLQAPPNAYSPLA
ncbi:uncharacterized protein LY89DRAFT_763293 [Mollisia scopiformis]|uniref:2EXR domain-containing protein n=1 Tax=Mollisia scopiformis TaxID=149040 RepID=A0A194XRP5_MOLSC|nr:uncharacterized protein LY89DRAFT_763293 [Mollisia scopiformis]KUJ22821.1 hypothetical protein LY89DRAFT_763293 [Mollisia scopiformis]